MDVWVMANNRAEGFVQQVSGEPYAAWAAEEFPKDIFFFGELTEA